MLFLRKNRERKDIEAEGISVLSLLILWQLDFTRKKSRKIKRVQRLLRTPCCYLELFVEQQLHHQLSSAENLSGQTEQSKQVVENHDLEVGQDGEACVPRSAACHLKRQVKRGEETGLPVFTSFKLLVYDGKILRFIPFDEILKISFVQPSK